MELLTVGTLLVVWILALGNAKCAGCHRRLGIIKQRITCR